MKGKEIVLNKHRIIVVDAPLEATHSSQIFLNGGNFLVYRKTKLLDQFCFDQSKPDTQLLEEYSGKIMNVGCIHTASTALIAHLFNVVKRGNFYDYEHNGIFYPTALSALNDIIDQETGYANPYICIIKP